MSQVNTTNDTIEIAPEEVLSAYFDIEGIATLNLVGDRTVITNEYGPELLANMQLISAPLAECLDTTIAESKNNSGPKIALIFEK